MDKIIGDGITFDDVLLRPARSWMSVSVSTSGQPNFSARIAPIVVLPVQR